MALPAMSPAPVPRIAMTHAFADMPYCISSIAAESIMETGIMVFTNRLVFPCVSSSMRADIHPEAASNPEQTVPRTSPESMLPDPISASQRSRCGNVSLNTGLTSCLISSTLVDRSGCITDIGSMTAPRKRSAFGT